MEHQVNANEVTLLKGVFYVQLMKNVAHIMRMGFLFLPQTEVAFWLS